jgi:hypothetical protein
MMGKEWMLRNGAMGEAGWSTGLEGKWVVL